MARHGNSRQPRGFGTKSTTSRRAVFREGHIKQTLPLGNRPRSSSAGVSKTAFIWPPGTTPERIPTFSQEPIESRRYSVVLQHNFELELTAPTSFLSSVRPLMHCLISFLNGTSAEHGISVGLFRENSGRHWSGILPC